MTVLRSQQFDDVYFSADDGMAESHHVFLDGNDLPQVWQGSDDFTIAETGFGTGLNFLCAWKLFEENSKPHQRLHFISVEKYPLSKDEVKGALSPWSAVLDDYIDMYLTKYPLRVPGPHQIEITDRVTLTIWFGDIAEVIGEWAGQIDAWFLDGFTPAKNPDMWSDYLFQNMARLSHSKTTFATFTAAGFVKRGLESVGFLVEKTKGFGRKRDMMRGGYNDGHHQTVTRASKSIAIIGGGLAGCAMAHMAHRNGLKATIYEVGESLAVGASGGQRGMINPKLTAKPTAQSDYYTSAYADALRALVDFKDVDFNIHGSKHLCVDADKDRRFTGYVNNSGWHSDHLYRDDDGHMVYPEGASVCPEKLCSALAVHADVKLNCKIKNLSDIDADVIILANGYSVKELLGDDFPVSTVRGQVSWIKPQAGIKSNICFGGYVTPQTPDGFHILGSSFQPWETDISLKDEDHDYNISKYNQMAKGDLSQNDVIGGWAALRTASKDRFPIVGQIDYRTYISTAHGSHGIISSLYSARIIINQIKGGHMPATLNVLKALSPQRFHKVSK